MKILSIIVAGELAKRVGRWMYETKKQEVITTKYFEVTLFACVFSKSILKSPINMQVLSRGTILLKWINQYIYQAVNTDFTNSVQ